ncbi:DUF7538 family protein [Halorubrum cibi]|uniref:Dehydrogenase n=1 Tax=Halorubrum cibi TaxID=413815 RepID=A0A521CK27_9EURY|nr:hypothetical protein [Halorubrum cibi]SMO59797.1 hypothetical protein SAMN06264867_104262 [Halorubrum cibi]
MNDEIAALVRQEGWRAEGAAARVHYDGGGIRFAVEFYAEADAVLYWTVPESAGSEASVSEGGSAASSGESTPGADTAAPVPRESVPDPLRRRIREDLADAGVDPAVERRTI